MSAAVQRAGEALRPHLDPLLSRYRALSARERLLVQLAALAVALFLLHGAVWAPVAAARDRAARRLQDARQIATTLAAAQAEIGTAGAAAPTAAAGNRSLLSIVDQATKDGTLPKPASRLQPDGDQLVRVWFENEPFDDLLHWIAALQSRNGLQIDSADLERQPTAGEVNARLSIKRKP